MLPDIIFSISLDIDPRHQESPYLFAPIPLVNTSNTEKKVKVSMVLDWNKHDTENQVGREQNISTIWAITITVCNHSFHQHYQQAQQQQHTLGLGID